MLFNSYTFWIFFAVVVLLYRRLPHRAQNRFLLLASYVFYGYWDWRFLSLILLSTLVDYFVALELTRRKRRGPLLFSLVFNLGLLGVFKYADFFVREAVMLFNRLGLDIPPPVLGIVLPVGISFYTFQTLSYTVDVYRGQTPAARNFLDFALYVSFFPQLVAGPIERSTSLMPQILRPRVFGGNTFRDGLYHVLYGLFKKIVIADNMSVIANYAFDLPSAERDGLTVLIGVYAFAFQIYGDFSAYSSIAQGVAKWLGFDLMTNFNHPYFATSPQKFWQRWHISLSTWLRDYLYIPLGGNRHGEWKTYRNLLLTMLLGGFWHGANWTFLIWGLIHGLWLAAHRFLSRRNGVESHADPLPLRAIKLLVTFHLVCLTWLFFRAESLGQALEMLGDLGGNWQMTPFAQYALATLAFFVVPLFTYEAWVERRGNLLALTEVRWPYRAGIYIYVILMLLYFPAPGVNEFIYFQF
jgi:alginate O-acetyltransferase complex protein AlgI